MASASADPLLDLARALNATGAPWYLFGAQAAILHGASRMTADIDATIAWKGDLAPLVATLRAAGFEPRPVPAGFIEQTCVVPLQHSASGMQVDLVLAGPGPEQLFLSRVVRREIEGVPVPVARAEDLIVMKVLAGRAKDLDDVRALIAANSSLDLEGTKALLRELETALDRSDLVSQLAALASET